MRNILVKLKKNQFYSLLVVGFLLTICCFSACTIQDKPLPGSEYETWNTDSVGQSFYENIDVIRHTKTATIYVEGEMPPKGSKVQVFAIDEAFRYHKRNYYRAKYTYVTQAQYDSIYKQYITDLIRIYNYIEVDDSYDADYTIKCGIFKEQYDTAPYRMWNFVFRISETGNRFGKPYHPVFEFFEFKEM